MAIKVRTFDLRTISKWKATVPIIAEIKKDFRFEAAHFLPKVPESHKCHKLHGHSYLLTVRAKGPIDEQLGWVMDLEELSEAFLPLHKMLDHSLLNEIEGLANPTSENVAVWIFRKLSLTLPAISSLTLQATGRISVTISKDDIF